MLQLAEVPLSTACAEDSLDQRRNLQPVAADSFSVVAYEAETRSAIADVVANILRPGCKRNQLEG